MDIYASDVYITMCAYDYIPCDATNHIIKASYITHITTVMLRISITIITTTLHYILVVKHIVMIRWHEILLIQCCGITA